METKNLLKSLKRRLGLITAILATLLVSQGVFGWTVNRTIYIYTGESNEYACNSNNYRLYYWGGASSQIVCSKVANNLYQITGLNRTDLGGFRIYSESSKYDNTEYSTHQFGDKGTPAHCGGSNTSPTWYERDVNNAGNCCLYTSDGGFGIAPFYELTVDNNSTTTYGGSGTSTSPYSVYAGTVKAKVGTATVPNSSEVGKQYAWAKNSSTFGDYGTTTTASATVTAGSTYYFKLKARAEYNSSYSGSMTSTNTLYFEANAYKRTANAYYKSGSSYVSGTTGGTVKIGTGTASSSVNEIDIYSTATTFTATAATGYTFKEWNTASDGTGTQLGTSTTYSTGTSLSSDVTVYALFEVACPAVSQASISGDGTMYVGDTKEYSASATGGTITSYAWTVPSGLSGTSTSSTISITATGSGSKTLKAKATNDCGNTGTDGTKTITVSALPSVTNQNATAVSNSQINLTWKHNANKTTVMVVRYLSSASITDPTQGQEYNTTDKKTIGAGTVIYKGTDESFQSTGLTAATSYTYYFYTVNNNYYSSGVNYNATTHSACVPPTSVTTADASNIKSTSATLGGSYSGGSGTPTEVGIEWVSGDGKSGQEPATSVTSSFSVNVTGLTAGTEYTYKAYAKACETIVYGDVETLTTCAVPVMAQATRNNDYGSDYLKFNVKASSLGCTVTEWGVNVYSNSGCTSLVKSVQGAGSLSTSPQVVNVTGLISNTNYWVKSYAKYDDGDKMVEASTATRWQPKVVLGETSSSSVTSNSATLSSSTLLGGGAKTSMTALFRYSTSEGSIASGATIASSQTQVGQTISANLTGLTSGTTYYYRVEVTYTDEAGNSSTVTVQVNIDLVAPTISTTISNQNWTNQNVTATTKYSDVGSGISTSTVKATCKCSKTSSFTKIYPLSELNKGNKKVDIHSRIHHRH